MAVMDTRVSKSVGASKGPDGPTNEATAVSGFDDELKLIDLARALWHGRRTIFLAIGIAAMWATLWLATQQRQYTAQISLVPAKSNTIDPSTVSSGLSGLASLAGFAPGSDGRQVPEFVKFQTLLTSHALANRLERDWGLLKVVYESEWDDKKKKWHPPTDGFYRIKSIIKTILGFPRWTAPGPDRLAAYLRAAVVATPNTKTGILTLKYANSDPRFALYFLTCVHRSADQMLREQAAASAASMVERINQELRVVTESDHRAVLLKLLLASEQNALLAQVGVNFAADILDPAYVGERATSPKPVVTLAIFVALGLLIGTGAAFAGLDLKRLSLPFEAIQSPWNPLKLLRRRWPGGPVLKKRRP